MMCRLVLGDRAVGNAVATGVADEPETLWVVTDDSGWSTTLREAGIRATEADPADPTAYPDTADVIVVAAGDDARGCVIAEQARQAFPKAMVIAVCTAGIDDSQRESLDAVADKLVDPTAAVADAVGSIAGGDRGNRMARLLSTLRSLAEPLGVVAHDNPDPDAIASAIALTEIADHLGVESEAYYFGEITHQENRALVNLLSLSLTATTPDDFSVEEFGAIALVDHARPGVNDGLPPETIVQLVIDHHPQREPIDDRGGYLDLRPAIGSTSAMMADYFQQLGIAPDESLATALLYGIQTDTDGFTRGVAPADFEAAAFLSEYADERALTRIESPMMSHTVADTLAAAIADREVRGTAAASCVGRLTERDALPQAADKLLDMEGVETVVVFGYDEETIYVSGRSRGSAVDLGETLRDALDQVGSAGGHATMAGAQVPMGILDTVEEWETLSVVVHDTIAGRFFDALNTAPRPGLYGDPLVRFPPE